MYSYFMYLNCQSHVKIPWMTMDYKWRTFLKSLLSCKIYYVHEGNSHDNTKELTGGYIVYNGKTVNFDQLKHSNNQNRDQDIEYSRALVHSAAFHPHLPMMVLASQAFVLYWRCLMGSIKDELELSTLYVIIVCHTVKSRHE